MKLFIKASSILVACILIFVNSCITFAKYEYGINISSAYLYTSNYYLHYLQTAGSDDIYVILLSDGKRFLYTYSSGASYIEYNYESTGGGRNSIRNLYENKIYYTTDDSPQFTISDITDTNIPITNLSISELLNNLYNEVGDETENNSLGYLQNIGYHVDAYGLDNNPSGTNELVSWGQYSTTDIDLSDSRYQVEFALRDTSTMTSRNMYESFLNQFPRIGVQLGPINLNALETTSFLALTGQHLVSMFYPSGSEEQAVLRGQAVRTDLFGKVTSLGLYSASNRKASLNCFGAYKRYFADMTDNNAFKRYIDSVGSASTRNDFWNNAKDYFTSYGANYNVSYDIMARIVDSTTGNKGEWISINKHNTPYINSDQSDRLNGGVTCTTGITMGDTVINEGDFVAPNVYAPSYVENEGDTAIYLPTRITVGYVDNSNSSSVVTNNYTNYEYNYGDTFIYNEYPNVGVTTDDDGEVQYTDDGSATENINHALRLFKYIWQKYTTWFNKLFGAWLPDWAKHIVIISLPISFTGILFKIAKQILPLLGNLALRLVEFGTGLFLPGE